MAECDVIRNTDIELSNEHDRKFGRCGKGISFDRNTVTYPLY